MRLPAFHDPASVAVVGASADPAKWGHWLARGARRGRSQRRVYLVNRDRARIGDTDSYARLGDLPEPPELAVISVPAPGVEEVVDEALDLGTRAFLVISTGLDRVAGRAGLEDALRERVRQAGGRLLGPNSLGLFDAATELQLVWGEIMSGGLGIVSQSGQLGLELAALAADQGIGVSRFVSTGNQADVRAYEVLADLAGHDQTRAVVCYLESFLDGREILDALRTLADAGKPVVLLTVGRSDAGREAAQSHTGALTSTLDVVDAACRSASAVRVDTPKEAVDVAQLLCLGPCSRGRRIGILADSGGQGAVAADVAAAYGLTVPPLPADLTDRLAVGLPPSAVTRNPVDLAGGGEQDLGTYARVSGSLLTSGQVDAVLLSGYFGRYGTDVPSLAEAELGEAKELGDLVRRTGRPVAVHSMDATSTTAWELRRLGVPVYGTVESAVRGLAGAAQLAAGVSGELPRAAARTAGQSRAAGYWEAREILAGAGIPYPRGGRAGSRAQAVAIAAGLRAPLAVKADWIVHKSDAHALALGLATVEEVGQAYDEMSERLGGTAFVVEEVDGRAGAVELMVGVRTDPAFGPVVLVGAGGTEAELHRDIAVELVPVGVHDVRDMIRRLRAAALLDGWRGRPGCDIEALAACVAELSALVAGDPGMLECEINPLRVTPTGVLAVDAYVVRGE